MRSASYSSQSFKLQLTTLSVFIRAVSCLV